MSTKQKSPAPRLLVAALIAALASTSPAYAQQSTAEMDAARAAELRAVAAREAATARQAQNAERHIEALQAAEAEQRAALAAVEAARAELMQQAEEKRRQTEQGQAQVREQSRVVAEQREMEAREARELSEVKRELERAHANLRRASQEVAQVHRELHRADRALAPEVRLGASRAVIGVVLGNNTPEGVQIIGISPDGPAERAGLQQGDVIVSLMGEPLSKNGVDGRRVLSDAMDVVEPGDELTIVYRRGDETIEKTLTAEERTPFSWQSVTRLSSTAPVVPEPPGAPGAPTAPAAPEAPLIVQSIDLPTMEFEELKRSLKDMEKEFEERRIIIERFAPADGSEGSAEAYFFGLDEFSEAGDAALASAGLWFAMPLTRGLKLAELDPELGSYFQAEEGVLVLAAREDNALMLKTGDVILSIASDKVQRPGDVVRALRNVNAGDVISLQIMRHGVDQTLDVEIPGDRLGQHFERLVPGAGLSSWEIEIRTDPDESENP